MIYSGDGLCSKHKFYYIFKPSKCSKIGVFGVVKFVFFHVIRVSERKNKKVTRNYSKIYVFDVVKGSPSPGIHGPKSWSARTKQSADQRNF